MHKDSNKATFLFSSVMVIVIAIMLSVAAIALGPYQARNTRIEKMENILCANYCGRHIIKNAGHWVQQENPTDVIKTLLDFYKNK